MKNYKINRIYKRDELSYRYESKFILKPKPNKYVPIVIEILIWSVFPSGPGVRSVSVPEGLPIEEIEAFGQYCLLNLKSKRDHANTAKLLPIYHVWCPLTSNFFFITAELPLTKNFYVVNLSSLEVQRDKNTVEYYPIEKGSDDQWTLDAYCKEEEE